MNKFFSNKSFTLVKSNLPDDNNEKNSSADNTRTDTALTTILGSLKLYNNDRRNNAAFSRYQSTDVLYDIVIRINNLNELCSQGWEILLGKDAKNVIPLKIITGNNALPKTPYEPKEGVIVTVLGAYNRGKSYLLKKLCKIDLPNGNLVHTEGISITAGRQNYRNIVFLDTAGTDTPVNYDEIESRRATDALLREVVLHLSTFIIIVVNRLRYTDQKYIKEIMKYCRTPQNKKAVIIVHNLLDVKTIEDLHKIIEKEIIGIFGATKQEIQLTMNGVYKSIQFYVSKQQQGGTDVRHFILAKTHSDAAAKWNTQSLDGMMNIFQNSDNKRSLDIINDMINFINNKLPQLFKHDNNDQSSVTQQSPQIIQHDNQPYIVLSDRKGYQKLSEKPHDLKLSEKLVYDDAGYFVRNEAGHWQPLYNLYEDDTKYCLIIELSGFKEGDLKTELLSKSITIEGTRSDLNKSQTEPTIRQSDIPIGSFKLNIPFKEEIVVGQASREREHGFIRITLPKKKEEQISLNL